jgi:hypothetical protein
MNLARLVAPARVWRTINVRFDQARIWYKITYERGKVLATDSDVWKTFDDPALLRDPRRFYHADGPPPRVETRDEGRRAGARVTRFAFATHHPLKYAESNRAVGWFYRRDDRAPIVLVSHGWAHRSLRGIELMYVRRLLDAGFSVAFVSHPLHFDRTPAGAYSGELLVSADVVLTVEGFRQAVADLCATARWLRSTGHPDIGVFGYSLGGYVAGLLAVVRDDWAFVVLGGAGDSLASPILDTPLGRNVRDDLAACGMLDRRKVERAWAVISPGRLRPRLAPERILLVAGRYDRIMLPASVRRLHRAWDRPPIVWLDRGHYALLATTGGLLRRAVPFMRGRAGLDEGARAAGRGRG